MPRRILINPGTFEMDDATEENAVENMRIFVSDIGKKNFVRVPEMDYGGGRFCFLVWEGNRCHTIQMPGWPLDLVRYMGQGGKGIIKFPRLYVDDASWLWCFATEVVFYDEQEN